MELGRPELIAANATLSALLLRVAAVWEELGLLARTGEAGGVTYRLTLKGKRLCADHIDNARARYWLHDRYLSAWLSSTSNHSQAGNAQSSEPDTFAKVASNPEWLALSKRVLASYASADWKGIEHLLPLNAAVKAVVDLGGGTGELLSRLVQSLPNSTLICFDRPEVVADQQREGVYFVAGDLFSGSMPTANLYVLSRVLHDWPDHKAVEVLQRVYDSSPLDCTLCVIDRESTASNAHARLSLHMHVLQRSRERTGSEWDTLFRAAKWHVHSKVPFSGHIVFTLRKNPARSLPSTPSHQVLPTTRFELLTDLRCA